MTAFRVVHFADAHMGFESYGHATASGVHTRVQDVLDRLDEIVAFVSGERIDLVCFAGDAFRTGRPGPTVQALFAERVREMAATGAAVLLLAGDLDQPRLLGQKSPLDIYPALHAERVHVARSPGVVEIPTRAGAICVACLPHLAHAPLRDVVASVASAVPRGAATFLCAHVLVAGAECSGGQAQFGDAAKVHLEDVANPRFPYIALGHVRRHQGDLNAGRRPFTAYAGSIERADFSEEAEEKGFYVFELSRGELTAGPEFVPLAARPFRTVDVTLPDGAGPAANDQCVRAAAIRAPDAFVRIRIEGTREDLAHVRPSLVAGSVSGASGVHVEWRVRRIAPPAPARMPEVARAESEAEALDAWLDAHREIPDRDLIRRRGRELIADVLGAAL